MNITVFRVYQLNLLTAISMYMKSLFYLFLSIVGAWLFSSCSDDFLGETETTDLDQATVFADSTYNDGTSTDIHQERRHADSENTLYNPSFHFPDLSLKMHRTVFLAEVAHHPYHSDQL